MISLLMFYICKYSCSTLTFLDFWHLCDISGLNTPARNLKCSPPTYLKLTFSLFSNAFFWNFIFLAEQKIICLRAATFFLIKNFLAFNLSNVTHVCSVFSTRMSLQFWEVGPSCQGQASIVCLHNFHSDNIFSQLYILA